jgi:RNA polymerase sigma factor (sigma-70 family)
MPPTAPSILRHIRALAAGPADVRTDHELHGDFAASQNAAAFAALLRRHGPLVWGVCRRLLRQEQDAEDAFQATFMVLARKAGSIRRTQAVGGYCYGVAYRTAMNMRRAAAARRERQRRAPVRTVEQPAAEASLRELQALLDEEVVRLAEKYRLPFVLCCLEGRTKAEAARELGWKEGTVSSRLAQAREILRRRLSRRGVTLSAVLTAVALGQDGTAAVNAALTATTLRGVTACGARVSRALCAGGVLRTLAAPRWILAAALLATVGTLAVGFLQPRAEEEPPALASQPVGKARMPSGAADAESLPAGAVARLGTLHFRQGTWVRGMALSSDGGTLATVGFNGVWLWDAKSGKERRFLPVWRGGCEAVAFSPDEKTLAVGMFSGIVLLDAASGKEVRQIGSERISAVAFAPDGKTFAGAQLTGGVTLWETATGNVVARHKGDDSSHTWTLAFSPDGRRLAWAEGRRRVLLDVRADRKVDQDGGHGGDVCAVAFAPDGQVLATSGHDRVIRLWDVATGKPVRAWAGHKVAVTSLAFSPDGRLLASGSGDPVQGRGMEAHALRLWDVATGKELASLGSHGEGVHVVHFSRDGRMLFSAEDMSVRRWDVGSRKELGTSDGHVGWVSGLAFSPDGRTLATTGSDRTVRLWDTAARQLSRVLTGCEATVDTVAFSPDGTKLASASRDGRLLVWDAPTGQEVSRFQVGKWEAKAVFSPDGKLLAAASRDGNIVLWDAVKAEEVRRFPRSEEGVMSVALSPDGKWLATGHIDDHKEAAADLLRLWDVAAGKEVRRFVGPKELWIPSVAFSPDGRLLAAVGWTGSIHLWDPASGRSLCRLGERDGKAHGVAFSPDGRMLASAGHDERVRLWEVATGCERRCFQGHRGYAEGVVFSPDGKTLASGGWDTTVLLWDVRGLSAPTPEAIEACGEALAGADAARAYRAILSLSAAPGPAVRFLRERLHPAAADGAQVQRLVAALDSDDFRTREKAAAALEALGEQAEPALRRVLAGQGSAEVRRRAAALLEKTPWAPGPQTLRAIRAVEALEYAGSAAARELLQSLACGAPEARLTREAKAALARWR